MIKDQFGNVLNAGDVVIYAQGPDGGVPTVAKITKIVLREKTNSYLEKRSYISVRPVEKRFCYKTKEYKKVLAPVRALHCPERVIKVSPDFLEQALADF